MVMMSTPNQAMAMLRGFMKRPFRPASWAACNPHMNEATSTCGSKRGDEGYLLSAGQCTAQSCPKPMLWHDERMDSSWMDSRWMHSRQSSRQQG